ncbi:MAG: Maf family protein [Treponema sp.]|jgi:septum formation protein|nr:Maf family protein [Treponema sp.]
MEQIILASGSLRRQEYFKLLGLPFSVVPADIDESATTQTDPIELTRELAVKKVEKVLNEIKDNPPWIFGADTVVAINNKILGKPYDRDNAFAMLSELSGSLHQVITSIALYNGREKKIDCRTACCTVHFAALSKEEIERYLESGEWQGVAGAYRIQGLAGCFVEKIEGCPSTVVGLPLREFYVMLKDNGCPFGA